MTALEKAIAIAVEAHAGQTDKAGAPYILHPLRLMLRMGNETEMMAAVLHDVVEDGAGWTFKRLAEEGMPTTVIDAVDHLTKRPEDDNSYEGFIRRAATNPVARRVKLADLEDNMDLGRISNPTERDFARLAKYRSAYALLKSIGENGEARPNGQDR
jgi:(p)ppGpp synthase/HD superfamily hydrolase